MISLEVLKHQSLFDLLYRIDQDLAEQTRIQGCPFAGGRCITPIMIEVLEAVPLILMRHMKFGSVCAAAEKAVAAGQCPLRFDFGAAGYTGRRYYF
jgi:hypothetical protein